MEQKEIKKLFNFECKDADESDFSLIAVGSTEDIDRDNDIVRMDGIDLKHFKRNPILPWAHSYSQPPIGRAEKIRVEDGKLTFKAIFAAKENPQAKVIFDLYKGGFLNSWSIGFIPVEWSDETRKDGRSGRNYTKIQLLEISAVSVPSNPHALVQARGIGIDTSLIEQEPPQEDTEVKVDLEPMFKQLKDDTAIEFAKLLTRMIKSEEKIEVLSKTLEAIINPKQSKDLFSEEIRKLKNFTIK